MFFNDQIEAANTNISTIETELNEIANIPTGLVYISSEKQSNLETQKMRFERRRNRLITDRGSVIDVQNLDTSSKTTLYDFWTNYVSGMEPINTWMSRLPNNAINGTLVSDAANIIAANVTGDTKSLVTELLCESNPINFQILNHL